MTTQETIDYINSLKRAASKDTDKRAKKYIDAMDSILKIIHERRALQNRCLMLTRGMLCNHCQMECYALGIRRGINSMPDVRENGYGQRDPAASEKNRRE